MCRPHRTDTVRGSRGRACRRAAALVTDTADAPGRRRSPVRAQRSSPIAPGTGHDDTRRVGAGSQVGPDPAAEAPLDGPCAPSKAPRGLHIGGGEHHTVERADASVHERCFRSLERPPRGAHSRSGVGAARRAGPAGARVGRGHTTQDLMPLRMPDVPLVGNRSPATRTPVGAKGTVGRLDGRRAPTAGTLAGGPVPAMGAPRRLYRPTGTLARNPPRAADRRTPPPGRGPDGGVGRAGARYDEVSGTGRSRSRPAGRRHRCRCRTRPASSTRRRSSAGRTPRRAPPRSAAPGCSGTG